MNEYWGSNSQPKVHSLNSLKKLLSSPKILHYTVIPQYQLEIGSRTPYRNQNPKMFNSLIL